jgi:alpha-L-fucosidase 2
VRALALFALLLGSCTAVRGSSDAAHVIWLDHPAEHFTSALPLGNGTMGALVFGGVDRERIVLNAHEYLPQIRKLLLEGQNLEAEALLSQHFTCAGAGSGQGNGANVPYGCYQVLTSLLITFDGTPDLGYWYRIGADAPASAIADDSKWQLQNHRQGFDLAPNESALFRCRFEASADVAARIRPRLLAHR